jgi:hypothetical protein
MGFHLQVDPSILELARITLERVGSDALEEGLERARVVSLAFEARATQ